ncbi:MAG TPA: S24/S26 family peptidase [Coriobacteriia bacterium]
MRKLLSWLAEPLAVLGIVLSLAWAAHSLVTPVCVTGGSMSPALVPGDIALVALGRRPIAGDIALIRAPGHGQVVHRVVDVADGGAVRMKGDANQVADFEPVPAGQVAGRCIGVLPFGSWLARWRGRAPYATMASQPNSTRR